VVQTSVKKTVCVLAGYVIPALKWKRKVSGVRSRAVTSDHTFCEEKPQPKFIMLYMNFVGIV
jgi:hypothetical protein